jgi:hypothetical protein
MTKPMRLSTEPRIVRIEATGKWAVFRGDRRIAGPFASRTLALWAADAAEPKRRRQAGDPDAARS